MNLLNPVLPLGEKAVSIEKLENDTFIVTTESGIQHKAPNIAIAAGLGSFEPRKPPIPNLQDYENKGVDYIVKDPEKYRGKEIIIAGGGDSALDWTVFLADVAKKVTMVHRRTEFRGHPDSVQKAMDLAAAGKITLLTNSEVIGLSGEGKLQTATLEQTGRDNFNLEADYFLPLFGLSPKLGPIADWGLNISKNAIDVNTVDYSTNVPGIYAIGDINNYEGKLKLILCGFHEATLMVQSAFKRIYPNKNLVLKYTTVNGVQGFDS